MKELKKIDESLAQLQHDFNTQLEVLGTNTNEFHNAIIELSTKYPAHKELLQFMVFINDKLETNQSIFEEVVTDSFNSLIKIKKELIAKMIEDKDTNPVEQTSNLSLWQKMKNISFLMKNLKVLLTAVAVILLSIGMFVAPDLLLAMLKALAKLL
jgi:hypothetical protein